MNLTIPFYDLWWLAAAGGSSYYAYLRGRARQAAQRKSLFTDRTGELLHLQSLYGYNPHSFVSITPKTRLWTTRECDGGVAYDEYGNVRLVAGDALTSADALAELARRFTQAARENGKIAAFAPTTERFARAAASAELDPVKVGAAPYFDLKSWNPRGDKAKNLRAGVNQAQRAGVHFTPEAASETFRRETEDLCKLWLGTRRAGTQFGWLFALSPFECAEYKKYFTARDADGQLVGFLAATRIPARNGWYLEDVLRRPDAPNGTADLLVVEALRSLAAQGYSLATLGTAPLAEDGATDISTGAHPLLEKSLRLASVHLDRFYNFNGLRRFKAKFVPSWWESEYALIPRGVQSPARVAYATLRAMLPDGGATRLIAHQFGW